MQQRKQIANTESLFLSGFMFLMPNVLQSIRRDEFRLRCEVSIGFRILADRLSVEPAGGAVKLSSETHADCRLLSVVDDSLTDRGGW